MHTPPSTVGLVLLYHRVAEPSLDPQLLCVSRDHFAEHLDVLAKRFRVVPLESVSALAGEAPGSRVAAITFDDGFSDNLRAEPLLAERGMTATVFAIADAVGRPPWTATLEYLVLRALSTPPTLELDLGGRARRWDIEASPPSPDGWNVQTADAGPRHALYRELSASLRELPGAQRDAALADLACQVEPTVEAPPLGLSPEELYGLAERGVIAVGAHTQSHPLLAVLDVEEQRREIAGGKRALEEAIGRPVTAFAYPYGGPGHYTGRTIELVREAGFELACANVPQLVRPDSPPFELPRFLVRDWDGDEFERRLRAWVDGEPRLQRALRRLRATARRLVPRGAR